MMEGNCSNTSPATHCSTHNMKLPLSSCAPTSLDSRPFTSAALPGFLTYLFAFEAGCALWGGCTGCADSGGTERRRVVVFWH